MTIKVNKARLIAAITKKRDDLVKENGAAQARAGKEFTEWKKAVREKVKEFLSELDVAKDRKAIQHWMSYGRELKLPECPSISMSTTAKYDAALQRLALVEDDVVTLNENRDSEFLGLI